MYTIIPQTIWNLRFFIYLRAKSKIRKIYSVENVVSNEISFDHNLLKFPVNVHSFRSLSMSLLLHFVLPILRVPQFRFFDGEKKLIYIIKRKVKKKTNFSRGEAVIAT